LARKLSYHQTVNYAQADPAKVLAQKAGLATAPNMPTGFEELPGTRGESAYVFKMNKGYGALVQEGLGTKSLIAQAVYQSTGESFFAAIAQDTVACVINDLISVGATPVALNAYWSSSSYDWLTDTKLATDFIQGWQAACDATPVVWGGGETQSLSGIVVDGALEFAGSAFGTIATEQELIQGKNLQAGDAILLVEASGVHANGISLIRQIADQLPAGYQTKLPSGTTFGEAALVPTHLYSTAVRKLRDAKLDIHYLSNITGHGWRKLMRAEAEFTYRMHTVPPPQEIFPFIAEQAGNDPAEMYGNYNMGAGYAVYLPADQAEQACTAIKELGLECWVAGTVENGPKQVVIEPNKVTFGAESLEVR
jgi:phosphoribosylformylglycinamidine cyclo-ligase